MQDPIGGLFFPGDPAGKAYAGTGEPDWPSRDECEVCHVAGCAIDRGPAREETISLTIPRGWLPPDPESGVAEILGEPHFVWPGTVALPSGETRTFEITEIGRNF